MPDLCEAHLERTGKEVPAYKLGLCKDCYKGRDVAYKEPLKDTIVRPADCGRCGKPRHRGGCAGAVRGRYAAKVTVSRLQIEHATWLLQQGKTVDEVVELSRIPRGTVERLKGFLGM